MAVLDNINSVAKYESKLLMRSWFYRVFLILAILVLSIFNFAFLVVPENPQFWIMRALPSNIPYINLLLLNTGQAVIAVFLSSEFLKSDKKLDTSEVFYVHPLSNAEYVIGKIWGNMNVFIRLNLIIICLVIIFNIVSGVSIDWGSYVVYFFLISVPTLIYIFGLSIGCMLIIKNQAITFVLLLGYIALTLFYISDKFYYLFDYMVYNTPLVKSSIVGFTNWASLINHRLMYILIGFGFICISIFLFRRLPNTQYGRYRWLTLAFCFIFAGLFAGFRHVNAFMSASHLREKYIEINNKYVNTPQMVVDDYDIYIEQFPSTIAASVTMHGIVQETSSVFTFCLNPSLTVREIKENGKELSFTRDNQIILINFGRILETGDTTTYVIKYDGRINEQFCYLDIPDDLLREKYASDLFNIDKKYSFQTENYILFTPEIYWYPRPGVSYSNENPDWQRVYFSNYHTTVKTINGLLAITQGTRLAPREKMASIRSNEYDSNDGTIRPVGGMRGGGTMMFFGGGPMGGMGGMFGGGGGGPRPPQGGGNQQFQNRPVGGGGGGQQPQSGGNQQFQGRPINGGQSQGQARPPQGGDVQQQARQPQGGGDVQQGQARQQGGGGRGQQTQGGDVQQQARQPQGGGDVQQRQRRAQGGDGQPIQRAQRDESEGGQQFQRQQRPDGEQSPGGGTVRIQGGALDSAAIARMRVDPEFRERMRDSMMIRVREAGGEPGRPEQNPENGERGQQVQQPRRLNGEQGQGRPESENGRQVQRPQRVESEGGQQGQQPRRLNEDQGQQFQRAPRPDREQSQGGEEFRIRGGVQDSATMTRFRNDSEFRERMRDSIMRMREDGDSVRFFVRGGGEYITQSPDGGNVRERMLINDDNTEIPDSPPDSIFIFQTDYPTPAISLIIGDYEQKCVEVDHAIFSMWNLKGNDFYSEAFESILDTIPYQIRLRRQSFENNYALNYSFRRFSVIEVPVQFSSYVRAWTKAEEVMQPEMVLFPEKGCIFNNLDIARQIPIQKTFAKRMGREMSDNDAYINVFNNFLMTFQRSEGAREFSMDRGTANIVVKPNSYFLFPQLYNFRYNIFSSDWTIANRLIELYLQDLSDNNMMRQMNGISNNEKANILIQKHPFKELLNDPEQRDLLDNIISLKAKMLFAPAELKIGNLEFTDSLRAYLNNNRFSNLRFEDLLNEMSQISKVDLSAPIATWNAPTQLPAYIVAQPEITYIINRDVEVYVTKIQITNNSDTDGIINLEINFSGGGGAFMAGGGRGGGGGGFMINTVTSNMRSDDYDPRAKRKIALAAHETKLIVNVWDEAPRSINVNTLISSNLPNLINMTASNITREQNVPIDQEGDFVLSNVSITARGEVIVDNEDTDLFELSRPDIVGLLPKWFDAVDDDSFMYAGVQGWRPPLQWTLTTNAGYYGTHIRSAYVIKSGSGSQTATWKIPVPSKGLYDLFYYVYKPDELRRNNNFRGNIEYRFKVQYDDGQDNAYVNLRRADDGWYKIGTYFFNDDTIKVVLTNEISGVRMVTADAVKIVRRTSSTDSESNIDGTEL